MYILRRRPGLLSLNVAFASVPGALKIDYTLERFEQGERVFQKSWQLDVPESAAGDKEPADKLDLRQLPTTLPDTLAEAIAAAGPNLSEPLWLHLIKPYGMLGIVAWEQALTQALGRPVFRLPDFLAKPCELEDVLECAVLWDHAAQAVDDTALDSAIDAWLEGSGRTTVHVHLLATDAVVRERLADRWKVRGEAVTVYAAEPVADPNLASSTDAFAWIERAIQGVTLDVLQVAAGAELCSSLSTLMLTGSGPGQPLRCAGVADLATLLNRLGAWCAVISGVPGAASEPALRHFADALAQARPGPVMYHALTTDRDDDLLTSCGVLFSASEIDPLPLVGGFLYCTPSLVSAGVLEQAAGAVPRAPANDLLLTPWPTTSVAEPSGQPPPWVAAAQRVVEEITLEHSRSVAGDNQLQDLLQQAPQIAESLKQGRAEDVVQQAIDDIQSIIRQSAVESVAVSRDRQG